MLHALWNLSVILLVPASFASHSAMIDDAVMSQSFFLKYRCLRFQWRTGSVCLICVPMIVVLLSELFGCSSNKISCQF
jgi:hypothetical protein